MNSMIDLAVSIVMSSEKDMHFSRMSMVEEKCIST